MPLSSSILCGWGSGALNADGKISAATRLTGKENKISVFTNQPNDASKNSDSPDMKYIDSWDEFIGYIRGEK